MGGRPEPVLVESGFLLMPSPGRSGRRLAVPPLLVPGVASSRARRSIAAVTSWYGVC